MSRKTIVVIGGGGHARALIDILTEQGMDIGVIVDPAPAPTSTRLKGIEWLSDDEQVLRYLPDEVLLVNGIGAMPYSEARKSVCEHFRTLGYTFMTVIARSASVSQNAIIEEGAQVLRGAIVNNDSVIGTDSIINTSAVIEHDCRIARNCHVAPGATLSGGVKLSEGVHVATGANIINGVTIGANTIIGVGANITASVGDNMVVYGAKNFTERRKDV